MVAVTSLVVYSYAILCIASIMCTVNELLCCYDSWLEYTWYCVGEFYTKFKQIPARYLLRIYKVWKVYSSSYVADSLSQILVFYIIMEFKLEVDSSFLAANRHSGAWKHYGNALRVHKDLVRNVP